MTKNQLNLGKCIPVAGFKIRLLKQILGEFCGSPWSIKNLFRWGIQSMSNNLSSKTNVQKRANREGGMIFLLRYICQKVIIMQIRMCKLVLCAFSLIYAALVTG